ncbi:hypothetical protein DEU56DRAFT_795288 [Suillus clintonianus]|uniref:uncharacterized protein n=1 Tax=Suillus clintonianus TaxID=1904413 RepID=UPI001B875C2C|nr:uncharacterized protein DEU56DRAFT_795288 [Suillus clintonianus]KAG2141874.1 hypothetical protein DEU56DRAFT_795288 [Suillus clintonianus]
MQATEGMAAHSKTGFLPVLGVIGALQNILARSQVTIPDLDTPYSRLPNTDQSAMHRDMGIGTIITERQHQLDAVLHEISDLEAIMDSIENLQQQLVLKQAKITQSLNLHKGLVSPLWRLPIEVLSKIFHLCLPEFDKFEMPSELDAPVVLTRVCQRWREVAVGIPSLWSRPSLSFCPGDQWERQTFCYGSWLERSRGRPLSLTLCWNDCPYDSTKIQSLLQPYTHQISSLSIHFSQQDPEDHPELLLDDLPALRELNILTMDLTSVEYSIAQLPSTVTNLKILWSCFTFETLLFHSNPVWTHLTTVVTRMSEPNAFIRLLKLCPNLSSLMIGMASDSFPVFRPFTHTNLQSLYIVFNDTSDLASLFNSVLLPNLRVLETSSWSKWPHNGFKAFLTQSACPLESLIFSGHATLKDAYRAEYVALIPSLDVIVDPSRPNCYDLYS